MNYRLIHKVHSLTAFFFRYWLIYRAHLTLITRLGGIRSKNRLKALIMASPIPVRAASSPQSHLSSKAEAMVSSLTHPRVGNISSSKTFVYLLTQYLSEYVSVYLIFFEKLGSTGKYLIQYHAKSDGYRIWRNGL